MKKFYQIEDFIDTTSNAFVLKGTSPLTPNASEVTMCSSANVLNEIETQFGERSIYVKETETPFTDFTAMWTRWLSRRGDRLAASWEALHTKYKPLENYDRYEAGEDTKTLTPAEVTTTHTPAETTVTDTPAEVTTTSSPAEVTTTTSPAETTTTSSPAETTNTITPAETTRTDTPAEVTDTRTPTVAHKKEEKYYAFNSASAVPVSSTDDTDISGTEVNAHTVNTAGSEVLTVDEAGSDVLTVQTAGSEALTVQTAGSEALTVQTAGSEAVTVQHAGSIKTEVDSAGSDAVTVQAAGEEKIEYGKHVYGNIGVTSAMDLIRQEMEIDEKDFVYRAICEFINLYTVYV